MDYGRGAVILSLALLASWNFITIPVLFGAQFVISLMNALFGPTTMAMLPDLVAEKDLNRANSTIGSINSISAIVGPALGGVIYGLGGINLAFLVNGISFIASGVSEFFISYEQKTKKLEGVHKTFDDLKEGFIFAKNHTSLLTLLIFALITNFFLSPVFSVLLPYVAREVIQFSSQQYGGIQASFMIGLLIGNVIIGTFLAKKRAGKLLNKGLLGETTLLFVFAALIFPISIQYLGYASWTMFFALSATFIFVGSFNAFVNTPLMTELQKLAPTEFRARIFSVLEVGTQGIIPIGFGIMGLLLDIFPAHFINLGAVICTAIVTLAFVFKYSQKVIEGFENTNNTT